MATLNQAVTVVWDLATGEAAALTGLDGNMTATLTRFPTTTTSEAGTETVTIAEVGVTGFYTFTFTPVKAYEYALTVEESSLALIKSWDINVLDAPATATADKAYCAEADVVAWAQFASDFTASTIPTQTQVLGFMEMRAAEIRSWLSEVMDTPPGPSGYSTTIDNSTDAGLALERTTKMANAIGAAMDALEAAGSGDTPAATSRVVELGNAYAALMPIVQQSGIAYENFSGMAANHITKGEISEPQIISRERQRLSFDQTTKW